MIFHSELLQRHTAELCKIIIIKNIKTLALTKEKLCFTCILCTNPILKYPISQKDREIRSSQTIIDHYNILTAQISNCSPVVSLVKNIASGPRSNVGYCQSTGLQVTSAAPSLLAPSGKAAFVS